MLLISSIPGPSLALTCAVTPPTEGHSAAGDPCVPLHTWFYQRFIELPLPIRGQVTASILKKLAFRGGERNRQAHCKLRDRCDEHSSPVKGGKRLWSPPWGWGPPRRGLSQGPRVGRMEWPRAKASTCSELEEHGLGYRLQRSGLLRALGGE